MGIRSLTGSRTENQNPEFISGGLRENSDLFPDLLMVPGQKKGIEKGNGGMESMNRKRERKKERESDI